jgi:formamidopyrimidine-DNA glycosylase
MPELPEVETIRRRLDGLLSGGVVEGVEVLRPDILRETRPAALRALVGERLHGVRRMGKLLLVEIGDRFLVFHLKMTGRFSLLPNREPERHTHLIVRGRDRDGQPFFLNFTDPRRFGRVSLLATAGAEGRAPLNRLGPDALTVGRDVFIALIRSSRRRVKEILLDQARLAGVGNIYADEALHRSRIHPASPGSSLTGRRAARLHMAVGEVLREALERGGSSIRDYLDPCGEPGSFQDEHRVYGRTGEPCRTCATPVRRVTLGGRGTHFCPRCQPPPRRT